MKITLGPIHLAFIAAFIAGILVAGSVLLAAGERNDSEVGLTGQLGIDSEPVATAEPEPTATPSPAVAPEPAAEPAPVVRTCEEIRADGTYNSDEERAFFLANCVSQAPAAAGPSQSASGPAPPRTSGPTPEEEAYRRRAEGKVLFFYARLLQYIGTPSFGAINDILEFGTICRGFANDLNGLEPVPPRFRQAHDQLRTALLAFADHIVTVQNQTTPAAQSGWLNQFRLLSNRAVAALEDYALVVGIDLRRR